MSLPNPLLDDLQDDLTTLAIEEGNLRRKREWKPEVWTSEGYIARIANHLCRTCGSTHPNLLGLFHKETSSKGNSRETALSENERLQFASCTLKWKEVITVSRAFCPVCAETLGFS